MLQDARQWLNSGRIEDARQARSGATALHVAAAKGYSEVLRCGVRASGRRGAGRRGRRGSGVVGHAQCRAVLCCGFHRLRLRRAPLLPPAAARGSRHAPAASSVAAVQDTPVIWSSGHTWPGGSLAERQTWSVRVQPEWGEHARSRGAPPPRCGSSHPHVLRALPDLQGFLRHPARVSGSVVGPERGIRARSPLGRRREARQSDPLRASWARASQLEEPVLLQTWP